jgi:hypothetical protein
LDYDCLGLKDSFHTQGFYQREASLIAQVLPLAVVAIAGNESTSKAGKAIQKI